MSSYANETIAPSSTAQPNPDTRGGTKAGASIGRKLEGIISRIHGAGEQIRGRFNLAVDKAMHDREGQARNQGIIDRGREEYNTGRIINNPEKRRYPRQAYPSNSGGGATAGAGTTTGTGTATETGMPADARRGMTGTEKSTETAMPAETGRRTTGTGEAMSSATAAMPQSPRLTEGSYEKPGPTNPAAYPENSQVAGGPEVEGVNEPERRV